MNSELSNQLKQHLEQKHSCIVCGSEDFSHWASEDYLNALRCNQCGMTSINPHFTKSQETPCVNMEKIFKTISDDIVGIARDGDRDSICASPLLPGSMLTAAWHKC